MLPNPQGIYHYLVTLYTGNRQGSGTTAKVFFKMAGDNAETIPVKLWDAKRPCFERGQENQFIVSYPEEVGELSYVQIWHNNAGVFVCFLIQTCTAGLTNKMPAFVGTNNPFNPPPPQDSKYRYWETNAKRKDNRGAQPSTRSWVSSSIRTHDSRNHVISPGTPVSPSRKWSVGEWWTDTNGILSSIRKPTTISIDSYITI